MGDLYNGKTVLVETVRYDEDGDNTEAKMEIFSEIYTLPDHASIPEKDRLGEDFSGWLTIGTRWGNYQTFSVDIDEMKKLAETMVDFYKAMYEENVKFLQAKNELEEKRKVK